MPTSRHTLICFVSYSARIRLKALLLPAQCNALGIGLQASTSCKDKSTMNKTSTPLCLYLCFCALSAPIPLITFTQDVVLGYEFLGLSARLPDTK